MDVCGEFVWEVISGVIMWGGKVEKGGYLIIRCVNILLCGYSFSGILRDCVERGLELIY